MGSKDPRQQGETVFVVPAWLWVAFVVIVIVALAVDLLAHRNDHVIKFKEAAWWSAGWVGLAVAFGVLVTLFVEP